MINTHMAGQFLRYQLRALTRYELHSPFLFALEEEVLYDNRHYYAFDEIEHRRDLLLQDKTVITIEDYGAGSHTQRSPNRRVSDIARTSLITPHFGRIMFKLVQYMKPRSILEMGTSLGISSLYMAKAAPSAQVITLEGSSAIANIAAEQHIALQQRNIEILTGEFGSTLPLALQKLNRIDIAFIDGNHRLEPTLAYFEALQPFLHDGSVIIFDDIHWSAGMDAAWKAIKQHPRVTCSVDLFYKGIVACKSEFRQPQHVVLRY
jgi:predicted O-methyltransferase YrrM